MSPKLHSFGLYFQLYPLKMPAVDPAQYFADLLRHYRGEVIVRLGGS